MGKTINELHAMLKLHEQTLPRNNAHALHVIRAVSRIKMLYFSAVSQDGIFEIDLFDSYTNFSSIYAVTNKRAKSNLDSALLWHFRLGHISKKCIKKLQHDGLLNSTDLRAFEKCIPCMFGKMARTPYSHQVERAKDLLGLIHTDVCCPFKIMSRQKASYFVTFTDDFSHYGYVYLLKHKKEVFETFKVLQKEVENQLDRMFLYIDAEEHELGYLGEPTNFKFALLDPESDKWLNAMNVEMQSMKDNEVWDIVELSPNGKTVGSKWLFKKKTDMDGAVHTYKARLVGKGYTQTPRIDYEETFSPVVDIRAIRILIAIAAFYDYEIWKMDVKTAFLNGYLSEEVYMDQYKGLVNLKYLNRVCKPKRSGYRYQQKDKNQAKPDKTEHKIEKSKSKSTNSKVKDEIATEEILNGPTHTHLIG
uniref:Putative polyprotein n=1 Tax=Tanacetum cinerariifolium TaxID=118510 RepID=A0A699H4V0_TANCI|nr:putative polyprotein [Tanacetum cinerariifolium]